GLRTRGLVPKLSELTAGAYDPVILQVGGNDILYFTPLDELSQDITLVLEQARRLTDGQIILLHSGNIGLAPFFPRWAGWLWSGRTKAVREVFSKAARANGASYVDLYHNRADDPFLGDIQRFYSADYLHPTGAGYGVWYTEVEKYL
ncbi:MAG TPA: SGNH/GDSL hydrolase family protein, partial [Candidatus Saccharimonadales bacterium]